MSDVQIDVRIGVTIITTPDGQRIRVFHDDPQVVTLSVQAPNTDHPEAEVPDRPWQPLQPATGAWRGDRLELPEGVEVFKNDLYTVHKTRHQWPGNSNAPAVIHLSIRRNDRHWARDWRHFQKIKNELVDPECEGVELYPAESRLMDTSNQFHIWVLEDPGARFPFGYEDGRVTMSSDLLNMGSRQRPLADEEVTMGPDEARHAVEGYLAQNDPGLLAKMRQAGIVNAPDPLNPNTTDPKKTP